MSEQYQAVCEACGASSTDTGVSKLVAEDWKASHEADHQGAADSTDDPEIRIVEVRDE